MGSPSTVLIYEFFTGGGCPAGDLPRGLAAEALGMLWAVLSDFRGWSALRTITALDPRFEGLVPGLNRNTVPADEVRCVPPGGREDIYQALLKRSDAALIIAPETDGILAFLTGQAESAGLALLGSSSSAVMIAGDKAASYKVFREASLPTPETHVVNFKSISRTAGKMRYPLVLKPVDGVGCEGVCAIRHPSDLAAARELVRRSTAHDRVILQSLVPGVHASVSLLVAAGQCRPLSLNLQLMEAGLPFKYLGSQVPLAHPAGIHAVELARSAAEVVPGLLGYVGVDLVLSGNKAQLIEINPRLTTSYIGLRQVSSVNLAQAIWGACTQGVLPDPVSIRGEVVIQKDEPLSWGLGNITAWMQGAMQ